MVAVRIALILLSGAWLWYNVWSTFAARHAPRSMRAWIYMRSVFGIAILSTLPVAGPTFWLTLTTGAGFVLCAVGGLAAEHTPAGPDCSVAGVMTPREARASRKTAAGRPVRS